MKDRFLTIYHESDVILSIKQRRKKKREKLPRHPRVERTATLIARLLPSDTTRRQKRGPSEKTNKLRDGCAFTSSSAAVAGVDMQFLTGCIRRVLINAPLLLISRRLAGTEPHRTG